jgi:hypothetical protein
MRYLLLAATAVGVAAMPIGSADAAKKTRKPATAIEAPAVLQGSPDFTGGNAAAGGNNANSMSGSNSAGSNANGRTSGGRS